MPLPIPIQLPPPPDRGESTPRPSGCLLSLVASFLDVALDKLLHHRSLFLHLPVMAPIQLTQCCPSAVSAPSLHLSSAAELHSNRYVVNWLTDGPITPIRLPLRLHRIDLNHQTNQMETRAKHWPSHPPSSCHVHHPTRQSTVIEWLHYPLGYSDGKDHSKIIISKRWWFCYLFIQNGIWI
jgi:hypothetical protein